MAQHYLKLAVPAIVNAIFMAMVWNMNIICVVRMGSAELVAGFGVGITTLNIL
jgi:Na+-driven multidrug efflux pump